jgi:tRNA (cmo5U34)-methyltransferase
MQPLTPDRAARPREDWFDGEFVESWLSDQPGRSAERLAHFSIIRSAIPRAADAKFRYLNLGAGDGWLDEVILSRFTQAEGTLLDGSTVMLQHAQERLKPFGARVHVSQGDLSQPTWRDGLQPPYDVVVSSIAIHNLFDAGAVRALYGQVYEIVADGGVFLNLDYLRPVTPLAAQLSRWAGGDAEAKYTRPRGSTGGGSRGSLEEQLIWLRDGGFAPVDCLWKEFHTALLAGFKGDVQIPQSR